jgi:taurine-pyruvate aminotransferase
MGDYLMEKLRGLQNKYKVIGDVRGKGLFCGFELVKDRQTKEPVDEKMLMAISSDCMEQGVVIGRTNRSLTGLNNTICLSPALICKEADIDEIVTAIDNAMSRHAVG